MVVFANIQNNWNSIVHRQVLCCDDSDDLYSLNGRFICLTHTIGTPLKALSGLGRLVLAIVQTALIAFAILTLNSHPKNILQAAANVIDVPVGTILLPVALIANIVRGMIGTIFHPGAMIKSIPEYVVDISPDLNFPTDHNILYGTLVNYKVDSNRRRYEGSLY